MTEQYNQWGQLIEVGNIVGYVSKTGSHTTRKIGTVTDLTEVKVSSYPERFVPGARISWDFDGSYCDDKRPPVPSTDKDSTVRLNNLFKLTSDTRLRALGALA